MTVKQMKGNQYYKTKLIKTNPYNWSGLY